MVMLGDFPASEVEEAFAKYLKLRSQFPAPADIIGIITGRIKRDSAYYSRLIKKGDARSYEEDVYVVKYETQIKQDFE